MHPGEFIRRSAQSYANNVVVWFEGREQTYAQMFDRAKRLANVFREMGAKPGDRVAVLGDNAFETVELAAACALGNFPRATFYTYHAAPINRYLMELTGATILVVQAKYHETLAPLLAGLPRLKGVLVQGSTEYEKAIANASAEDLNVPVADDDVHIIRFSSGTTGKPKGIAHSVERWQAVQDAWRWVTPMITEQSRYLTLTSIAHLGVAFLWGTLTMGARIVPVASFDPREALDLLESQRVTHAVAAPVMIREMVKEPDATKRDLTSLRCLMYAGSPIAATTLRSAIQVFGSSLYQLYAQGEAQPITMLLPQDHVVGGTEKQERRLRSVGRGVANMEVTVRGENGEILPPEAIGEIAARGPSTMSCLWEDPAATAERTLPDGSVLTRDMGFIDTDGYVYLVDRKDDMIVSGGYNVWPTEIEQALFTHPAVAEACVFGVPHEKWGETPKAIIVLKEGMKATEEELIAHTRELVGGVKKVTSVEFRTSLPRTPTGKVQRGILKEPYWKGHTTKIAGS